MSDRSKRPKTTCVCAYCGNRFEKETSQLSKPRYSGRDFCSTKCLGMHKHDNGTVSCLCAECKQPMVKIRSEYERHTNLFCSHSCSATFNNRLRKSARRSKIEIEFFDRLQSAFPSIEMLPNDRTMLDGMEVDIAIPSLQMAIEWNGLVHFSPIWGEEKLVDVQNRDRRRIELASRKDINLIVICDDRSNKQVLSKALKDVSAIIDSILSGGNGEIRTPT